jgi:peptide deformylase
MILPITHLPAKVLRTPTKDVVLPPNKDVLRLIKNMLATVKKANGVGLAAPQVGKNLNLAIIYLEDMGLPPFAILNPEILTASKETEEMEEGCLSMPHVFGMVKRPKKITMAAYDLEGKKFQITDDTFLARVLQHEIDHLNQTLIIDKLGKITSGAELLPKFQERGGKK